MTDEIKQQRQRELEVRTWFYTHTGKHIRSRAHLARIAKDYAIAKAVAAVMKQDVET